MSPPTVPSRDVLLRISKWLVARERRDEAVQMLCAVAATSAGTEDAQGLLGAALEVQPQSPLAKAVFERMEGSGRDGDHVGLDAAVAKYGAEEIDKLHREMNRPQFMRAQVGFNNNVKYKDVAFHVQTEDSGVKLPHIITHLFADGGRVIKSHKRSYADDADRADVGPFVRGLMKAQHMEMVAMLRAGKFDEIIAGRARGGMEVLTEPPQTDVQQMGKAKAPAVAPPAPVVEKPRPSAPVRFALYVMRSTYGGPEIYEPPGDEVIVGKNGGVPLAGERFCHHTEGVFHFRDGELFLEDLPGGNGIFIRIRHPVELEAGDEFVLGDQLLRLERNADRNLQPDPGPTYLWFSPCPPQSAFRIIQILQGGAEGETRMAGGTTLQIGRREGDMMFPNDPRVADRHCLVEEQAGVVVLTDLMSRTGVFVRLRGEQRLFTGDELLVGRTVLRVDVRAGR
ncbi:MAG: FHA domain-containing protein [Deltaproteobacteria bacterium]|nr:FHA domain-containing protein [Deltaproteobacteria bacterium]